jgi:hypothetical protein
MVIYEQVIVNVSNAICYRSPRSSFARKSGKGSDLGLYGELPARASTQSPLTVMFQISVYLYVYIYV